MGRESDSLSLALQGERRRGGLVQVSPTPGAVQSPAVLSGRGRDSAGLRGSPAPGTRASAGPRRAAQSSGEPGRRKCPGTHTRAGNVQAGDSVLIHAGSSGVGTAAIQLARLAGAIPLVTAGSQHKLQMAEKLGAAAGFNYREEDFSEATLKFTKGAGVNLILDCIGGSYWEKNVNCLASDGRWVLYGLMGGTDIHGPLFSKLLFKRGSLITTLLRSRDQKYKQMLVEAFTKQILPHFSTESPQRLLPVLDRVYPATAIQEAHEYMESNKNVGKIVLELPQ
ncbi:quinone oxidoreductase PIG3 isoform X2 [Suricata suricatta]|uniref:Tumor protein p53 inducible protein 3 n=1 Tax=Suricata suricatta TaxID=37032 RepID=A0A673VBJ4_SURSU|nr:quinone oxidoreductase PIG3 isoform X2 [Suricata suricatta]